MSSFGTIQAASASGNGATVAQTYISGSTAAGIRLPEGSLPAVFTICSMTRYTGSAKGRIINAFGANFSHGHDTYRGVAYYGDTIKWVTNQTAAGGNALDWLVMCGKSSSKAPGNMQADGQPVGVRDTALITANWQLGINTGQAGSASDWSFGHMIVWDQVLSEHEVQIISSVILKSLTNASVNFANIGLCDMAAAHVMCTKPTWARYHATSYDAGNRQWLDTSGNNRHTISSAGTIQRTTAVGNGATVPQTYIYGDVNAQLVFPLGSIPASFTICTTSRIAGGTARRVFNSPNTNFILGHDGGVPGAVYWGAERGYVGYFDTPAPLASTDWLVLCAKNPGTAPNNVLAHGRSIGRVNTNFVANWQLTINNPSYQSDFAVSHVIIFDTALSDADMAKMSTTMLNSLSDSSILVPKLGQPGACNNSIIVQACNGTSTTSPLPCSPCRVCSRGTLNASACFNGCTACPYGTYSNSRKVPSACSPCPAGSHSTIMATRACAGCSPGKYSPFAGMTFCLIVSFAPLSHMLLTNNGRTQP